MPSYKKTPEPDRDVARLLSLAGPSHQDALRVTLEEIKAEKPDGWPAVKQFLSLTKDLGIDSAHLPQAAHMLANEPHGEFAHYCSEQQFGAARDVLNKQGWLEMNEPEME